MNINWNRLHLPAIALAVALLAGNAAPAKAFDFTGIYLAPKFVYGIQVPLCLLPSVTWMP